MPAGQNHSNFALNTRLSAPRYDTWCKIQVITFFFAKSGNIILIWNFKSYSIDFNCSTNSGNNL